MTIKSTAARLAEHLDSRGVQRGPHSFVSVVADGNRLVCHTEATLDTWWHSLTPVRKASVYELDLEQVREIVPGVCRFCGCTDMQACEPACMWIDAAHTMCNAIPCFRRYTNEVLCESYLPSRPGTRFDDLTEVLDAGI